MQLIHPPWFDDDFDALGVTYFRDHGFDAWVSKAVSLPSDPARVTTEQIVQWVVSHVADRAEANLLACTGFRSAHAIDELERWTGRTVVGANQALLLEHPGGHEDRAADQRLRPAARLRHIRQPDPMKPTADSRLHDRP